MNMAEPPTGLNASPRWIAQESCNEGNNLDAATSRSKSCAASKVEDDHDLEHVPTKELRDRNKSSFPAATHEPKGTNCARCIEPREDKCKQELYVRPGEDSLGITAFYSARQHNEGTPIASPASQPDKDHASMLPGTQLLPTQMQPQHHLLGSTSPFLWDQQSGPVELGGSSAVVSSSGGQRSFAAFPAESGISKNATYFSPGAGPGRLQPGWAESHLIPHSFNGLQVSVEVPTVFITPAVPPVSPALAPATISALPQSQPLSAAGPCSASGTGGISSAGGLGDLQRPLGLSLPAAAAAGGGGGGESSASPPQQIHLGNGPPHVSAPLSLGPGPLVSQQHEGLLPVTTSAQARAAAAELATSICPAAPSCQQGGTQVNGLCNLVNAPTTNPTTDGGGASMAATGIDQQPHGATVQPASGPGGGGAAPKQVGGLSLRRIKPATVDLQISPNLVEQRQPVQQQVLLPRSNGGAPSCLPGSYTQRPAFANFLGCEPSISPSAPSDAAASSTAVASGNTAVTPAGAPCTVANGSTAISTGVIGDAHATGRSTMLGAMQPQQTDAATDEAGVKASWTPSTGTTAAAAMSTAAAMPMWSPVGSYPFSTNVSGNSGVGAVAAAVTTAAPAGGSRPLQQVVQDSSRGIALPFMLGAQPQASSGLDGTDGGGEGPSDSTACAGAVGGSALTAAGTSDPGVSPFSSQQQQQQKTLMIQLSVPSTGAGGVNAVAAAPTRIMPAGSHCRDVPEPLQQQHQGQQLSHSQPPLPQQMGIPSVGSFADQFFAAMVMPSGGATTPESILPMQGAGSLFPAQAEQNSEQSAHREQRFAPLAAPAINPSALQLMAFSQMAQQQQHQQAAAAMSLMQQMWRASLGVMMPMGMMGLGLGIPPGMVWPAQMGLTTPAAPDTSAPPNMAAAAAAAAAAATQFPALFNPAMMLPVLAPFALPLQAAAAAAAAVQPLAATTAAAAAVSAVDASCTAAPASVVAGNAATSCGTALRDGTAGTGGSATETAPQRPATSLTKSTKGITKAETALQVLDSKRDMDKKKQQQPQQQQQPVGVPTSFSGPEAAACVPSTRGPSPPSSPPPASPPVMSSVLVTQVRPDLTAFASAQGFLTKETKMVMVDPQTVGAVSAAGSNARSRFGDGAASAAIAASVIEASGEKPAQMEARKRTDGIGSAAIEGINVAEAGSPKLTGCPRLEAKRLQSLASADLVVVDALQLLAASPPPSPHRERRASGTSGASVNTAGGAGSRRSSDGGTAIATGEVRTKGDAGKVGAAASRRLLRPHSTQARRLFDLPDPAPIHRGQEVGGGGAAALGVTSAAGSGSGTLAVSGEGRTGMPRYPAAAAVAGPCGWARRTTPPAPGPSGTATLDRQRLLHLAAVGVDRVRRQGPVQAASASVGLGGVKVLEGIEEGQVTAYEPQLQLPRTARRRRTRTSRAAAAPGGAFLATLQAAIEATEPEELVHSHSSPTAADGPMEGLTPPGFLAAAPAGAVAALAGAAAAAYSGARRSSGGGTGGRRVQWAAGDEDGEAAVRGKRLPTVGNEAEVEMGVGGGAEEEVEEDDWGEESQEGPRGVRRRSRNRRHQTPSDSDGACEEESDGEFHMPETRRPARGGRRGSGAIRGGPGAAVIAHRVRNGASVFAADSDGGDVLTSEDPGHGCGGGEGDDDPSSTEPVAATRRRRSGHGRPPGAGNLRKMKPRKVQSDGRLGFSMRSSKYTGVYRTPGGRWRAQFCYRGAVHQLGMYDTEREAAAAWDQAVVTFRGSMSGVQLNLPQLLNSYDMQNVREHIHRILDSKIATTRTKRCLNSYSRNPPGPKSPSRVVPAAVTAADIVATETGVADPVAETLPRVGGSGGATIASSHVDLSGVAGAANSAGLLREAAAAAGVGISAPSSRGLGLLGPAAGRARRRRRSPSASSGGGWEGGDDQGEPDDSGSDGGVVVTCGRRSVRRHTGAANRNGDGGVAPIFPAPSGGAGGLPQLAGQDGADSKQQQRLRVLSVDDAAMLGLAALRRQLPHLVDPAEVNTHIVQQHRNPEGVASHAAANIAVRAVGPATAVADDTVASGKRPSEMTAGATASLLPALNHGSVYVDGGAMGGAIDGSVSSSGGEGDGGGPRCVRPSSPKRRKSHAVRSRDY